MSRMARQTASRPFVLGRKKFVAITAVEGLTLTREADVRLRETEKLTFEQRREVVIRAYAGSRKRS